MLISLYLVAFGGIWWYLILVCCILLYFVVFCGIWWYLVVFGRIWGNPIHPYVWYVWYGMVSKRAKSLTLNNLVAGCPVPLKTLKRLRGWEDERIERIERMERIERIERNEELGDLGDIVRSSELWRKQRVTPHAPHAAIAEGSADLMVRCAG